MSSDQFIINPGEWETPDDLIQIHDPYEVGEDYYAGHAVREGHKYDDKIVVFHKTSMFATMIQSGEHEGVLVCRVLGSNVLFYRSP